MAIYQFKLMVQKLKSWNQLVAQKIYADLYMEIHLHMIK